MKEVWVFSYVALYDNHGLSSYTEVFADVKDGIKHLQDEIAIIKEDHCFGEGNIFAENDCCFHALSTKSDVFDLSLKKREVKTKVTS